MKYKTTKQNTYNTIPKRANGNIFMKALYKEYNSTDKKDQLDPQIGCQYLEDRYYNNITLWYLETTRRGEQAPSLQ